MGAAVIGITASTEINSIGHPVIMLRRQYISSVLEAGGIPVLISPGLDLKALEIILDRLDGVLFSGGGDVGLETYGGVYHPSVCGVDQERDILEIELLQSTIKSGKPFLGICRGLQVINVALGGSLYSNIESQFPGALKHDWDSGTQREMLVHTVYLEKGSRLESILCETEVEVNSMHHQGIKRISSPLRSVAHAPDGLVEAVELMDYPFGIAVQWHPEWLPDQIVSQRLFRAFIDFAGNIG